MICEASSCGNDGSYLEVGDIVLSVEETSPPSITAGGLYLDTGWVRGTVPINVNGDSPSGVCSLSASLSGDPAAPLTASFPVNQLVWHQCDAIGSGGLSGAINTTQAPNGPDTLTVSDSDAAGLSSSASTTAHIDNVTPTVTFTGPSTALSTAGTQYVTETVNTGPSGAYGATCSVDGGPSAFYSGASADIPVSGLGPHTITCTGQNNAFNSSGARAGSAAASTQLDIQQPTADAITFSHIADQLRCHRRTIRVHVLRHVTIRRHGKRVVVQRIHTVKRHVRRCQARTVKRRVFVVLRRHGKPVRRHGHLVHVRRTERVELLPHRVERRLRHLHHGQKTTVSGQLVLAGGIALADRTVTVYGGANNAARAFTPLASATTDADGVWVAHIPSGPSRLLEAVYAGDQSTAPAISTTVRTIVPAKIRILSYTPAVAWGRTATFTGRVYGGYIPRGGINVRLRYGYHDQNTTYGVKTHVGPRGRFRTSFTFGPGDPRDRLRFRFRFATLPGGNYPFHVAESNAVFVKVGGHPRVRHGHRRHVRVQPRHHRRR